MLSQSLILAAQTTFFGKISILLVQIHQLLARRSTARRQLSQLSKSIVSIKSNVERIFQRLWLKQYLIDMLSSYGNHSFRRHFLWWGGSSVQNKAKMLDTCKKLMTGLENSGAVSSLVRTANVDTVRQKSI